MCVLSWSLEAQSSGVRDFSSLESLDSLQLEEFLTRAFNFSDNDSVLHLADTLINIARSGYGEYMLSQAYDLKSVALSTAGDWTGALLYQDSAIQIKAKNNWHSALGISYLHLGSIYWNEGELQELGEFFDEADASYRIALSYFEKALEEFFLDRDTGKIALGFQHVGVGHYLLYQYDEALKNYKESLRLSLLINDSSLLPSNLINISNIYSEQEMYDSARHYLEKASLSYEQTGNTAGLLALKRNLAALPQDDPMRTISLLEEADSLSRLIGDLNQTALIQENLSFVHQELGNYQRALLHLRNFEAIEDSIMNMGFKSQELNMRYQTNRMKEQIQREKEKSLLQELALEKASAQRLRLRVISVGLGSLFVLSVVFFLWRRKVVQQIQRQRLVEMEQARNLETARAMLTGQEQERIRIAEDLHDRLGSTLSAAKMQMEAAVSRNGHDNKYLDKSGELIDKAISDTREISHNMISGVLVKLGLAAALEDLRESLQITNRLDIKLQVDGYQGLPRKTELQLFRVVQELVNNSLKHSGGSEISINLEHTENVTYLRVGDNGSGFDPQKVKSGLGLVNIQRRIEAVSGNLEMISNENGSQFIISIED